MSYLLKDFTPDERERAWNPIRRAGLEWIGPRPVRATEEPRPCKFDANPGQREGLVQRRGKLSHRWLPRAVSPHQAPAGETHFWVCVHVLYGEVQGTRLHK